MVQVDTHPFFLFSQTSDDKNEENLVGWTDWWSQAKWTWVLAASSHNDPDRCKSQSRKQIDVQVMIMYTFPESMTNCK